ncbi:MAG: hypothetical protein ACO22Y_00205 [Sediminibacterium sp.]
MAQDRDIRYINRNFDNFRTQLIEFAKNYFPDTYNDFSATSPGMMFIEMASYVGDVLSFYQDTQLQETFLQHAKDPANLYSLAYMMGYRPKATCAAEAEIEVSQLVDAGAPNYTPNWNQALTIQPNTKLRSTATGDIQFFIDSKIDFSYSSSLDPTNIRIESIANGYPAEYRISKTVKAISGEVKTYTYDVSNAERFLTINIDDTDIIGVLDITDSDGNTWYEVPFLGQDTIYESTTNTATDKNVVPNILRLKKVPRRFVTRLTSTGILQVQFGAGVSNSTDETFLPDPTNVGLGTNQGVSRLDYAYDPSNFLFTRSYGLAPSNTTLTIRYIVGGGVQANVPANTINIVDSVTVSGVDTTKSTTLTFNNFTPAMGGRDGDTVEELRQNSLRAFTEQSRAVTLQDYAIRSLSIPAQYGSISKVYVTQDQATNANIVGGAYDSNPLALSLYVLAYNNEKHLIRATDTLKANLKTYLSQYMLLTDAVNIKDAFIVNLGLKYEIITLPNSVSRDVLMACNKALIDYFNVSNWSINQPINISNIYTLLDKVKGVQTVEKIYFENKVGGNYSEYAYDIKGATRGNILYPSYDPCIFEIKYPETDIQGRVTTL